MSRGSGIQVKKKYRYAKQPNGNYTIFGVEIFAVYTEKDSKGKRLKEITTTDLQHIVSIFEKKKAHNSYFPRAHVSHHDNRPGQTEERIPYGFLDYMVVKGNIVYCDIVEIPGERIVETKQGLFPYRSVEIGKDGSITSLAMLKTRVSFFDFPLLMLEDEPIELTGEENQYCQDRTNMILFSQRTTSMEEEEYTEEPQDGEGSDSPEPENFNDKMCSYMEESRDLVSGLASKIEKICQKLGISDDAEGEEFSDETDDDSAPNMPQTQETYSEKHIRILEKKVASLESQIKKQNKKPSAFERLQKICSNNPDLNYQEEVKTLQGIPEEARDSHLSFLTRQTGNYSNESPLKMAQKATAPARAIVEKYQGESSHIRNMVVTLGQNYDDTVKENKFFKERNPDKLKWIDNIVQEEKSQSGFAKRMGYV